MSKSRIHAPRWLSAVAMFSLLAAAAAAQEPGQPAPAVAPEAVLQSALELPADWGQRDVEGRWVWMVRDRKANASDPDRLKKWAGLLGEQEDFELLEMVGVYEGWPQVGPELARRNAPQWIRVAVWNLHSHNMSHSKENARDILTERIDESISWFREHPSAQRGAAAFYQGLEAAYQRADSAEVDALPPLDARQVLLSFLDAPAELPEFGDRLTAAPGARYRHQVIRALGGIHVLGRLEPIEIGKVVRLGEHPAASVRIAAFEALTRLPGSLVPWQAMLERSQDVELEPAARGWAAMVLSYSSHPAARFELSRIVADPQHPGWRHAVERSRALGGPAELSILRELVAAGHEEPWLGTSINALESLLNDPTKIDSLDRVFGPLTAAALAKETRGEKGARYWQATDAWLHTLDGPLALGWLVACRDAEHLWLGLDLDEATQAKVLGSLDAWVALHRSRSR